jgi:digeranylgeranylglycerophospholipid reductase
MSRSVDVLVIGGGPGGSVAARRCAEAGLRVLMIEKRQEIGAPVRCGEAIGAEATRAFIDLDPRWIDARITRFALCNAEGARAVLPSELTLVVNRKVFDLELARLAARAGAEVRARTQAEGLLTDGQGNVSGAQIKSVGQPEDVQARIVIAADGAESQAARWAGLKTVPALADLYVGLQFGVCAPPGGWMPDVAEYHFGPSIAPGGYAWVFPKSEDTANVGLVLGGDRAAEGAARASLDRFVARRVPGASILSVVAGGIPVSGGLKQISTGGLLVVGDAAHQAEPMTGGGINLAMMAAELAAQTAVQALKQDDVSASALRAYDDAWHSRYGRQRAGLLSLRRLLAGMSEREYVDIIATLARQPGDQMNHGQLMLAAFLRHPRLLLEARALVDIGMHLK